MLSDRVFSSARGFIRSYKIIDQGADSKNKEYEVTIKAMVSRDQLENVLTEIESLRIQQKRRGNKSVMVLYDPRAEGATLPLKFANPNEREVILAALGELNRQFLGKQFDVFDQNRLTQINQELNQSNDYSNFDQRALKLAQSNAADLLITFRLISSIEEGEMISYAMSTLSAKAVFAGNGQLIASSRQDGKTGLPSKSSGGVVYHSMASSSIQAAEQASQELVRQMFVAQPPKEKYRLIFSNLSIRQKRAVLKNIRKVPGYQAHKKLSDKSNQVDIELDLNLGDNADWAASVSELLEKDVSFTRKNMLLDSNCQRNRCAFTPVRDE